MAYTLHIERNPQGITLDEWFEVVRKQDGVKLADGGVETTNPKREKPSQFKAILAMSPFYSRRRAVGWVEAWTPKPIILGYDGFSLRSTYLTGLDALSIKKEDGVGKFSKKSREQRFRIRYYAPRYRGDGIPRILT